MSTEGPKRNRQGRFVKGSSGNPFGRPRKRPEPVPSIGELLARELRETVVVNSPEGPQTVSMFELLAKLIVRHAVAPATKPRDCIAIHEFIERQGGFAALEADASNDNYEVFSDGDREFLARIRKELELQDPELSGGPLTPEGFD